MHMHSLPDRFSVDLTRYDIPLRLEVFLINHWGLATNHADGSPERHVMIEAYWLGNKTGQPSLVYRTAKASATPLLSDPTESRLMSILAYHAVFDTGYIDKAGDPLHRSLVIGLCLRYQEMLDARDMLPGASPGPSKTHRNYASLMVMRLANIDNNQYYHIAENQYKDYTVWLKRRVTISGLSGPANITSRWTFVHKATVKNAELEDKWTFSRTNQMENSHMTFSEARDVFGWAREPRTEI